MAYRSVFTRDTDRSQNIQTDKTLLDWPSEATHSWVRKSAEAVCTLEAEDSAQGLDSCSSIL